LYIAVSNEDSNKTMFEYCWTVPINVVITSRKEVDEQRDYNKTVTTDLIL